MRTASQGGALYFLTFTDDCTRWTDVYFLRSKDQVADKFVEYKNLIENQTGHKIKSLQSDNGKEFCNARMNEILRSSGISRRLTTPHTPQQNGVAERKNRTLVEMARCMMMESGVPPSLWAEAIAAANFIRNRCPTKSLDGEIPFEKKTGRRPNLRFMQTFGCKALVLNKQPGRGKFDTKCLAGKLVGYSKTSKAFRVWIPSEHRVRSTRDVKFLEEFGPGNEYVDIIAEATTNGRTKMLTDTVDIYLDKPTESNDGQRDTRRQTQTAATEQDKDLQRKRAPGRPFKIKTGKPGRPKLGFHYYDDDSTDRDAVDEGQDPKSHPEKNEQPSRAEDTNEDCGWLDANLAMTCTEIPLRAALNSPERNEWMEAILLETRSLLENDAWDITTRPTDRKVIGSRTVLRNKLKSDGTLERRKARIVAKGYNQIPGVDFCESFSPVARLGSLRILMALAAKHNLKVTQLDVTTAFLYGDIDQETYMELPEEFEQTLNTIALRETDPEIQKRSLGMLRQLRKGNQVCKLKRAIYGLKQAGRQWHCKLSEVLLTAGFSPTNCDACIFTDNKKKTFILVYVDDLLIATNDKDREKLVLKTLSEHFKVKNLGEAKFCLGIEINRSMESIHLSQPGYIKDILERFEMTDCKPVTTPLALGTNFRSSSTAEEDTNVKRPYRELVGALMYLAVATRPDIAHLVSVLSQFNERHSDVHWSAAKRVLRYLKGTMDHCLTYTSNDLPLQGFVDADWAGLRPSLFIRPECALYGNKASGPIFTNQTKMNILLFDLFLNYSETTANILMKFLPLTFITMFLTQINFYWEIVYNKIVIIILKMLCS